MQTQITTRPSPPYLTELIEPIYQISFGFSLSFPSCCNSNACREFVYCTTCSTITQKAHRKKNSNLNYFMDKFVVAIDADNEKDVCASASSGEAYQSQQ